MSVLPASIEEAIRTSRPIANHTLFEKTRTVAEFFGEKEVEKYGKDFTCAFVYRTGELTFCYLYWSDRSGAGFGVEVDRGEEPVLKLGSGQIILYKPGEWERKLDRLHLQYIHRN